MNISRNDNPFEVQSGDGSGRSVQNQHGVFVTRFQLAVALITVVMLFVGAVAGSYIIFSGSVKKLYPVPINQNNFSINYSFTEEPLIAIADYNARFVVEIMVGDDSGYERGSGVIINIDNSFAYILTNYHVISSNVGAQRRPIRIKLFGSAGYSDSTTVSCIGYDQFNDIAVLRLNYSLGAMYKDADGNFLSVKYPSYVSVADRGTGKSRYSVNVNYYFENQEGVEEDTLIMGRRVLALGNALGQGMSACDGIVSMPLNDISVNSSNGYANTVIQTTAPINPGNSGGGLFDMKGQLIAINTYKSRTVSSGGSTQYVDNISYSVPIELALSSAYRIINYYLNADSQLNMLNEQGKPYSPTLHNMGIELVLASEISGAQEVNVVVLNYTAKSATIPLNFQLENGTPSSPVRGITALGEDIRDEEGRFINTITEVAGVSFISDSYLNRLSLAQHKLLLLKVQCLLYGYGAEATYTGVVGTGDRFSLVQQGSGESTVHLAGALRII